jgi:hypothetical protein
MSYRENERKRAVEISYLYFRLGSTLTLEKIFFRGVAKGI